MKRRRSPLGGLLKALVFFVFVIIAATVAVQFLPESAEETIEKTPQTEVHLPGSYQDQIDNAWDSVFGSQDDPATEATKTPNQTSSPAPSSPGLDIDCGILRVDFVDVGQADFIVIEFPNGQYMTIDGGNVDDSQLVYSYLENRNIEHIEHVVVTHAHEDHCGGVSVILSKCTASYLYSPVTQADIKSFNNVLKKAAEQNISITVPEAGTTFYVGETKVEIFGPVKDYEDPNNTSIVLKLTHGATTFLFMGDTEAEAERDMIEAGFDLSATVLKAGHHGSSTSSSYVFLREVLPEYIVIMSNREQVPEYDHPHNVVLSRYRDLDAAVYRTDLQGTITCYSDGTEVRFNTERNKDANTLFELEKEY